MGITNESVFEYCYYEYFVVDAHFDSLLLNKMMMKKKKKYCELVAIRTSYPISLIIFPRPMISKSTHVRRAEQQRMFCCWFWALLCFLLQMLYDDEPGVEDVSCGLSLKKKLGLMVVSSISRSSFVCCLGCWNQYPVGSLSRVVDLPPQMWSGKNEWRRRRNDVMLFQVHGQTYKNSSLPSYEELLSVSNYFLLD